MISKMGISTIHSYCGAQIFEAVGLDRDLVDRYFTGTPSRIGGVGLDVLAREALERHARAYPDRTAQPAPARRGPSCRPRTRAAPAGRRLRLAPRRRAPRAGTRRRSPRCSTPSATATAQRRGATRRFARASTTRTAPLAMLRGLLRFRPTATRPARRGRARHGHPAALHDRRHEPRRALARGARDARGGDEPASAGCRTPARAARTRRYTPDPNGDERRSRDQAGRLGRASA